MAKSVAPGATGEEAKKKQHRAKNAKLVKKRYYKRNKQKFKTNRRALRQIKRDKDELRKLGYINKAFSDKVPCDRILEISVTLQKMIKHSRDTGTGDCREDLVQMFVSLDEKAQVDLAALNDPYMQSKLLRLFTVMKLQHGKAIRKDDRLKFQKRAGDLHDFSFAKMIKQMLKRAAEKIQEREENSDDDAKDDQMMESSDEEGGAGGETSSDDEDIVENELAGRKIRSKPTPVSALPQNMPTEDLSSDTDSEEGAKGFLANTMGLIKDKKGAKCGSSKISNDLDALFGKLC